MKFYYFCVNSFSEFLLFLLQVCQNFLKMEMKGTPKSSAANVFDVHNTNITNILYGKNC